MKNNRLGSIDSEKQFKGAMRLKRPHLVVAAVVSLGLSVFFSACVNVAGFTQPSLVRVIDASYIAPAANFVVEGLLIAGNIGQGTITSYATVPAANLAIINVTASTGGASLVATSGPFLVGHQQSVFLADDSAAPAGYDVTILQDQQVAPAIGHSAFRFLNQAPKTGAVDIYMVPAGSTLANTIPLVTALPAGSASGYISFASQAVTMVITPTGLTTPSYTSAAISLTGGEVRTALIIDTQLTSNPPVEVITADDLN